MFQRALSVARGYTHPVVINFRRENGDTGSSIGTFIVLNEDGWILTASHIIDKLKSCDGESTAFHSYLEKSSEINSDTTLTKAQRKKRLREIQRPTSNPISHWSAWWGRDEWHINSFQGNPLSDIAVAQISGFDKKLVRQYPIFKNPSVNFEVGENLCKLGFPFHAIKPSHDETKNTFQLPEGALPIPFFPIDGIFTRTIVVRHETSQVKFVETSSPGLKGQSGGPTLDVKGRIWALQSQTRHYPLGFDPEVPNQQRKEHQFLNWGWGTHVETIIDYLKKTKIDFHVSED